MAARPGLLTIRREYIGEMVGLAHYGPYEWEVAEYADKVAAALQTEEVVVIDRLDLAGQPGVWLFDRMYDLREEAMGWN